MEHHWIGKTPNPGKWFGFIYEITNNISGKKYIGKKQYKVSYKVRKKGRKRAERRYRENWQFYTGSNEWLNKDIEEFGKENFTFKILWNCSCKGIWSYKEVELIVKKGALTKTLDNGSRAYYNGQFQGIRFIPKGVCK